MSFQTFEPGDTKQFTWQASVAPDAAPNLRIYSLSDDTVIASMTAQQSDSTHFWTLFTIPATAGYYRGEWHAQKTLTGSAYNLINSIVFQVRNVRRP
jgi:hypothetical protein